MLKIIDKESRLGTGISGWMNEWAIWWPQHDQATPILNINLFSSPTEMLFLSEKNHFNDSCKKNSHAGLQLSMQAVDV